MLCKFRSKYAQSLNTPNFTVQVETAILGDRWIAIFNHLLGDKPIICPLLMGWNDTHWNGKLATYQLFSCSVYRLNLSSLSIILLFVNGLTCSYMHKTRRYYTYIYIINTIIYIYCMVPVYSMTYWYTCTYIKYIHHRYAHTLVYIPWQNLYTCLVPSVRAPALLHQSRRRKAPRHEGSAKRWDEASWHEFTTKMFIVQWIIFCQWPHMVVLKQQK